MILVLTYHKVLRAVDSESGFYTIAADQLERQLELLSRNGLRALGPGELVGREASSERAYLLSFDDGTVDHYEVVLPLLVRYGCRAVFFVPSARLDRPGYLSSQQATELSKAGQTLGLHGHEHRRLDSVPEADMRQQMELSHKIIKGLMGESPLFFAPVGGYMNRRLRAIALESGIKVIRTMQWGYNQKLDLRAVQCIPVNCYFTEARFRQVLEFRRRSAMLYAVKEITKKMVPSRTYESLRRMVFRHSTHK